MSVHRRKDTGQFRTQFIRDGRKFSFSLEARTKKDAEAEARLLEVKLDQELAEQRQTGKAPITLDQAARKFWDEVGSEHVDSVKTWTDLKRVVEFIGPNRRMDTITDADVTAMVTWRKNQRPRNKKGRVAPATVNRSTTEVLKKLFTRARTAWRYTFPQEPNWRVHMLKEPEGVTRELQVGEEAALEEAMRSDYAPWVEFALLSGLRRDETLISWSEVDWHNRLIRTVGKRGKLLTVPISDAVAAILEDQKGKHEGAVFTYVAQRTVKSRNLVKGTRYPITYAGGKTEWRRLVARANVKDFRFHDLRHTFGSRLLRETGNLALVQKAMNHSDVKTTSRYAHVNQADLTQALQAIADKRKPWKSKPTPKSTPGDQATKLSG